MTSRDLVVDITLIDGQGRGELAYALAEFTRWSGLLWREASGGQGLNLLYGQGDLPEGGRALTIPVRDETPEQVVLDFQADADGVRLGFDLVSLVLRAHSLADEDQLYTLGRLGGDEPFASTRERYQRPIVNQAFEVFQKALCRAAGPDGALLLRNAHPGGAAFSLALSHDVDYFHLGLWERLKLARTSIKALAHVQPSQGYRGGLATFALGRRPIDLALARSIEEHHHTRSSLNLSAYTPQAGDGLSDRLANPGYQAHSRMLAELHAEHFELALHGSSLAARYAERFSQECEVIRGLSPDNPKSLRGLRQHMLSWAVPQTLDFIESEGLDYDTSLGFNDLNAFRMMGAVAARLYDPRCGGARRFFEFPLLFMDSVLVRGGCLNPGEFQEPAQELARQAACWSMTGSVCWHDVAFRAGSGLVQAYDQSLDTWRSAGGWLGAPVELADFLLAGEAVRVEPASDRELVVKAPREMPGGLRLSCLPGDSGQPVPLGYMEQGEHRLPRRIPT